MFRDEYYIGKSLRFRPKKNIKMDLEHENNYVKCLWKKIERDIDIKKTYKIKRFINNYFVGWCFNIDKEWLIPTRFVTVL
jgi:hypothetical protein